MHRPDRGPLRSGHTLPDPMRCILQQVTNGDIPHETQGYIARPKTDPCRAKEEPHIWYV